ncbi:MAG: hypothetical protein ACHQ1H_10705 [Nitrososphaerales archaeon]
MPRKDIGVDQSSVTILSVIATVTESLPFRFSFDRLREFSGSIHKGMGENST